MRLALRSLRGLNAQYRLRWGDMALVPEKRQPFSLKMLHAMAAALRSHKIAGWSAELHLCMLALVTFCLSTGMRRDEWSNTGDASYMRRSNFTWFKGNSEITRRPTPKVSGASTTETTCEQNRTPRNATETTLSGAQKTCGSESITPTLSTLPPYT
jgi:hypothetical protein